MKEQSLPIELREVLDDELKALGGNSGNGRANPVEHDKEKTLATSYDALHKSQLTALCLSGGGIRSATFALGVLQGLARAKLLDKFDYLSTVSGGGYIGSWFTAWVFNEEKKQQGKGLKLVINELSRRPTTPLDPDPKPIQWLRDYSNYLSPKVGLLSADSWTLIAMIFRNMILNWLLIVPLIGVVLMLPRFAFLTLPTFGQWIYLSIGFILGAIGIAYAELDLPSAGNWRQSQTRFLLWCLIPIVGSSAFLTLFWSLHSSSKTTDPISGYQFILFGTCIHVVGWMSGLLLRRSWPSCREAIAVSVSGAGGGGLLWWAADQLFPNPTKSLQTLEVYTCLAVPLLLLFFALGTTLYLGLVSNYTNEDDREWWARSGAWILIVICLWTALVVIVVYGPLLPESFRLGGGGLGLLSGLVAARAGYSGKSPPNEEKERDAGYTGLIKRVGLLTAAAIFIVVLLIAISLGTTALLTIGKDQLSWFDHSKVLHETSFFRLFVTQVIFIIIPVGFGFCVNVNKFSLHAMYGNRIVRGYLGASRANRKPSPFTGLDSEDNILMQEITHPRPLHVVNLALNLVTGERLAWQERKAESFTVTPLHAGNWSLGYRRSKEYACGVRYDGDEKGISLGKAITISGAAATPNMGYHSSAPVTFLMTLFNVRLGWWLGNPRGVRYRDSGPNFALRPIIAEALGLTDDKNPYVYLSDGGHFENLGLYEMVLRRCHIIVVSDGGCDPDCNFEDLGNAIRKIRIDLGIPIEFNEGINIYSRQKGKSGKRCALAKIRYNCVDTEAPDGWLLYIKPAFYEDEPVAMDIANYGLSKKDFPHEPTTDQWFSESQFESYRMLGIHTIEQIHGKNWNNDDLASLITTATDYIKGKPNKPCL